MVLPDAVRVRPRLHSVGVSVPAPALAQAATRTAPRYPRRLSAAADAPASMDSEWTWTGEDAFSGLGDRVDAAPLPLPALSRRKRVVLVRHGQSTWNAEGRIQGSSDFSTLTPKGAAQAATTRDMVCAHLF